MVETRRAFTNPAGDRLTFLRTAAETSGAFLEVEVSYVPGRSAPPEHYHPFQSEHFDVLAGTIHTRIGGVERTYPAGSRFEVPPSVVHTMRNGGSDVARVRWRTQPALRTEALFRTLWGLARDGKTTEEGRPALLQMAVLLRAYDREFRLARPPRPVQRPLVWLLAQVGRVAGYREDYGAPVERKARG